MTLAYYMDVHVDGRVTQGLVDRGLDVIRAQEDGFDEVPDPVLLDRAAELNRILVTCDKDFLAEASMRQRDGIEFIGIVFWVQDALQIGRWIDELETIAHCLAPDEIRNRVEYLPLK